MKSKVKKIAIRCGIVAAIAFSLFLAAMAVITNIIITPDKITPIVTEYVNSNYKVRFSADEIDVTFFSSFPHLGLKITNGNLVSQALHSDTLYTKRDSLLSFNECRASFALVRYLMNETICISKLSVERPKVRLFRDTIGSPNWDIVPLAVDTSTKSETHILLKNISLQNAKFSYVDRITQTSLRLDSANISMSGNFDKDDFSVDVKYSNKRTSFRYDGTRFMRRMSLYVDTHIEFDNEENRYTFEDSRLIVNGVELDANGWMQPDTVAKKLRMNIDYKLHAPSVEKAFALIPETVLERGAVDAAGNVSLHGNVSGDWGSNVRPIISCKMKMEGVSAKYKSLPYGIDELSADFEAYIDFKDNDKSHLTLNIFHFVGAKTDILAKAKVDNLFVDPHITGTTKSTVNLNNLTQMLPFKPGIGFEGNVVSDVKVDCNWSDIANSDYGRIRLSGTVQCDSLVIYNDSIGFRLTNDAFVKFKTNKTLTADARVSYFNMTLPKMSIKMKNLTSKLTTVQCPDTTMIVPVQCETTAKRLIFRLDSLAIFGKNIVVNALVRPSKAHPKRPYMDFSVHTDTTFARYNKTKVRTEMLGASMILERQSDSTWYSDGYFGFSKARIRTPKFKLPIEASDAKITQGDRTFNIERAHLSAGSSSVDISGKIHHLFYSIKKGLPFEASFAISGDTINCNELLASVVDDKDLPQQVDSTDISQMDVAAVDSVVTDSVAPRLFVVPANVNVGLTTNVNHVIFGGLSFDDVKGKVDVKNQSLHLLGLTMKQNGTPIISTMAYKATDTEDAYFGCFVRWEHADVGNVVSGLSLDTIMPMLKPLQGRVDCFMAAEARLDTAFNVRMNTLRSAIHIGADSLVLLDGETFAKMSKMLMFKNKKRNVFDKLSVNILMENGNITIKPFVVDVDRYRAVVGGHQNFDMKMDYHVSILKSPLPFKAGLNITGTPDDLKFDVTRARLKDFADSQKQAEIDSVSLNARKDIIRQFYITTGAKIPEQLR